MIDEKNMTFDDRTQPGDRLIPLQARYSCRSFSDQEIPEELLNQVIAAGLNAPTGGNLQPYTVLVIRNPETKKILAELCGQSFIGGAAVNLLFILDWHRLAAYAQAKHAPFVAEKSFFQNLIAFADIMCACQLMETAAYLSGLGACMVGNILGHGERLAELLHLPDRAYPIMMLALGYPARSSANRPKKLTPEDMVFQETYPAFSREEIIAAYEQKYGAITTALPRAPAHREDMLQRLLASLRTSYTEQEAQAILTEVSEAGFLNEMQRRFGLHYACSTAAEQADHLMKDLALRHILFQSCGKGEEDEHSTAQAVQ